MKKIVLIATFYMCLFGFCMGQTLKNNWYFGRGAAMSFDSGSPTVLSDNVLTQYNRASATANHPLSGKMLFYTNGFEIRNSAHLQIAQIDSGKSNFDVLILNHPQNNYEWYLLTLSGNGGPTGQKDLSLYNITVTPNSETISINSVGVIYRGNISGLTAVHNCANGAFWVLSFNTANNAIEAFALDSDGMAPSPVVSPISQKLSAIGDLVSNSDGSLLAISEYANDADFAQVVVLKVDNMCGILQDHKVFTRNNGEYAYGLAWSPNDQYLYVTYSVGVSQLVQIDIENETSDLIRQEPYNLNELQLGPDGKIYVATHTVGIPGSRVDVINKPNEFGSGCEYEYGALNLGNGISSNFHFPNFIQDYTYEECFNEEPKIEILSSCQGKPFEIEVKSNTGSIGTFYWEINEVFYFGTKISVNNLEAGTYKYKFYWEYCNSFDSVEGDFSITQPLDFSLGKDTSICLQDSLRIGFSASNSAKYEWSHGNFTDSFVYVSDTGSYCLSIDIDGCKSSHCIDIAHHESIWASLGDEYFLCPFNNELVQLDAGKGFSQYLWYPTGDSTQWIEVAELGEYFVMVDDFRGCSTSDSTEVKRRCPPSLYFPNAFSPNGDGLNDSFAGTGEDITDYHLQVYNRWGQCVFETFDLQTQWDGAFRGVLSPVDQYLYKCTYSGYISKDRKRTFFISGRVRVVK
ncbi:MAG: gliding motility-associated C-terminal domain-containing protein [Bacteroidia bacterium]